MAIVINGSGTVTGLSVGGLPDGTVDADTLASNAVTEAKIASNAVVTGKIADGTIANADINSSAAIAGSKLQEIGWGVKMSADYTASSGSWHYIPLNTELWDTTSSYNSSSYTFVVPSGGAGRYLVTAGMEMTSVPADKIGQISLRVNGSAQPGSSQRDYTVSGGNDDIKFTITTIFNLADNDQVQMTVYQNSGSDQTIASGETFFGGSRL